MGMYRIPALRRGQPYESLDQAEIKNVRTGEALAGIGQVNAGLIRRDARRAASARAVLRAIPIAELLEITRKAGDLFMEAELPVGDQSQSPDQYAESLSATSGLPHALVRRNMAKIHDVFTRMPVILKGLTRGMDLSVIDRGSGEQEGVPVSYYPTTEALGVVLPSNSPGVNSLWMPAIPLKIPVVLKPGREEPWTPFRIIQAFLAAGCPPEAFSFLPTDHEGSAAVMDTCGRALIFGDESTVQRYASNPAVSVHGPGRSKILIGADQVHRWPDWIELMARSIADNGGRSCVNASAVLTPSHGKEIAEALAKRLVQFQPTAPDDPAAELSGFANPKMAEFINGAIERDLAGADEVTARHRTGGRVVERDGMTYLLPTVVHCPNFDHPLANREFLFPYASVVEVPQDRMVEVMGPSLVVTAITEDPAFVETLVSSPNAERLNLGAIPTNRVQWDQPHEGNLFEFLYRRRAIQRVPLAA